MLRNQQQEYRFLNIKKSVFFTVFCFIFSLAYGNSFISSFLGLDPVSIEANQTYPMQIGIGQQTTVTFSVINRTHNNLPFNTRFSPSQYFTLSHSSCGNVLPASSTCTLTVVFNSPVQKGAYEGSIIVDYNGRAPVSAPMTFNLVANISFLNKPTFPQTMAISQISPITLNYSIKNDSPLAISLNAFFEPSSGFNIITPCTQLAAHQACTIEATYSGTNTTQTTQSVFKVVADNVSTIQDTATIHIVEPISVINVPQQPIEIPTQVRKVFYVTLRNNLPTAVTPSLSFPSSPSYLQPSSINNTCGNPPTAISPLSQCVLSLRYQSQNSPELKTDILRVSNNIGTSHLDTSINFNSHDFSWDIAYLSLSNHILSVATPKNQTNVVYIGTNSGGLVESGIYKSIDSGTTWNNITSGKGSAGISATLDINALIAISDQIIYAGTSGGVYKSTDGGTTWSAINNGALNSGINITTLSAKDQNTILAGGTAGAFLTENGGQNWSMVLNQAIRKVSFAPNTSIAYASVYTPNVSCQGVYISTNNGQNWVATIAQPTDNCILSLAAISNQIVLAGTESQGLSMSLNAGSNWQNNIFPASYVNQISFYDELTGYLTFEPNHVPNTPPGLNYIFLTSDQGQNWSELNQSNPRFDFLTISDLSPAEPYTVYVTAYSGGSSGYVFQGRLN